LLKSGLFKLNQCGWISKEVLKKTVGLIEQAGKDGVRVPGFPEVWIPGYPWYDFVHLSKNNVQK
jgi:predicted amidohydrolase